LGLCESINLMKAILPVLVEFVDGNNFLNEKLKDKKGMKGKERFPLSNTYDMIFNGMNQ